ncbi:MAG TPA: DUF4124 domain-containing protein [Gammaproteobacteria bacterium]|jgi:hypothetical protein|nr:DUF4124 domain-containing protein [Gammaproteobacteria bacterium]
MKNILVCSLALVAALLSPVALADNPQLYKWTDAQGVIHYSDQPPQQPVADLATADIPAFPPVDQVEVDKQQAALLAQAVALQQLANAQAAAQAEARAAAMQLAALQAPPVAPAADDSYSPAPIYVNSAFVSRAYRANLYLPRRPAGHAISMDRPLPHRAVSLSPRP